MVRVWLKVTVVVIDITVKVNSLSALWLSLCICTLKQELLPSNNCSWGTCRSCFPFITTAVVIHMYIEKKDMLPLIDCNWVVDVNLSKRVSFPLGLGLG